MTHRIDAAPERQPFAVSLCVATLAGWFVGGLITLAIAVFPSLFAGQPGARIVGVGANILTIGLAASAFGNVVLGWPAHHLLSRRQASLSGYLGSGAALGLATGAAVGLFAMFGFSLFGGHPLRGVNLGETAGAAMMAMVFLAPGSLPAGLASAATIWRLRRAGH